MAEHATASPQATQTRPDPAVEEMTQLDATPAFGGRIWDTLQQSIGNQAVGRMVEAQRAASAEGVTRITPWQQRQIEVQRSTGSDLEGAPGVRLHTDSNAAAMASGLGAQAFTQGRDVFFAEGAYSPDTDAGRRTLAHELTHVSEGRAGTGTVQMEYPEASYPPPNSTQPEETYTITLSTGVVEGLTEEQARNVLYNNASQIANVIALYKGEHQSVYDLRNQGIFLSIGAALTDLAGENIPELSIWVEPESKLAEAEANIGGGDMAGAAAGLKDANEAYKKAAEEWKKYKEQLENAAYKAQMEIIIVAVVVAVVVVAAAAAVAAGGAAAAGGGAAGGTAGAVSGTAATVPVNAAAAGAAATVPANAAAAAGAAATVPVNAAAAGAAATVPGSAAAAATVPASAAAAAGGAATVPASAAAAATVPAAGAGAAVGGTAAAGIAVDAAVGQAAGALAAGGEAAVADLAAAWGPQVVRAVAVRIGVILSLNAPFTSAEMRALERIFNILWKIDAGFPPGGFFP